MPEIQTPTSNAASSPHLAAIVGSYHPGGMADTAVDEVLAVATRHGITVDKIVLTEFNVQYCRNCLNCAQSAGPDRGRCSLEDDVPKLLDRIDAADGLILASPMNFGTVTAVMKTFIERLICYVHWPWEKELPRPRPQPRRVGLIIGSSAAPGLLARYAGALVSILRQVAKLLGIRRPHILMIGRARHTPGRELSPAHRRRTRRVAERLCRDLLAHHRAATSTKKTPT